MVTIRTTEQFEAAHRQLGDESKCGKIHGHNWKVEFVLNGPVGPLGYVVDFKDIKATVDHYDHSIMLQATDPLCTILEDNGQLVRRLPLNPTCENLTLMLIDDVRALCRLQNLDVDFISVTVWENDQSFATLQHRGAP